MTAGKPPRRQHEPAARASKAATREAPYGDEHYGDEHGGPEEGGEAACWAHLVCPGCGAVISEGHRARCPAGPAASTSR